MLLKRRWRQLDRFKVVGFISIVLAYSPGVFKESFWSDDYPALMGTRAMAEHLLGDARPTSAGLLSISFSLLKDPANAWILRALSLIAVLLIFQFVSMKIKDSRYYNFGVLSIAVALCLPSFQMYVHWSTAWFYPWAILTGLYSFRLWTSKRLLSKILGVLLLVLALTTYPPAAVFFFAVISVTNVLNESEGKKYFVAAIRGIQLLLLSVIISAFLAFATLRIAGISSSGRVRLITVSEIPNKVIWLFTRPLVIGLRPFTIDSPTPKFAVLTALPVLTILFFGIRRQSRHLGESFLFRASAITLPLLLSLIPIMTTPDNQIEFRVLPGYSWGMAAIGALFLLIEIESGISLLSAKGSLPNAAILLASAGLSLVAIVTINLHYAQFIGDPYQKKNAFLKAKISSCFINRHTENILIIPPKTAFPSFARLGVFSMSTDLASTWVPEPNVQLLLREEKIRVPVAYLTARPSTIKSIKTECVIDLEEFRKLLI